MLKIIKLCVCILLFSIGFISSVSVYGEGTSATETKLAVNLERKIIPNGLPGTEQNSNDGTKLPYIASEKRIKHGMLVSTGTIANSWGIFGSIIVIGVILVQSIRWNKAKRRYS